MPDITATPVAFEEAIEHLEKKVRIQSRRSDELRGAIHAKAFTVAGAMKAQLLGDLHAAVSDALAQGQSIGEWRKAFDSVVEKHGWSYRGKRAWRTRVIYDTNLRTAHMAGRWEQIQRTKERRPYLEYLTAGDTRVRAEHRRWDRTILPIDHAWWDTHYPPNDWGCRCTVRTLSQSQMERGGLTVSKDGPDEPMGAGDKQLVSWRDSATERINTRTGEIYGAVFKGIGTGWDYNVGKAWLAPEQAFGEIVAQLPPTLRAAALGALAPVAGRLAAPYAAWARQVLQTETGGSQIVVGYINNEVVTFLNARNITPATVTITLLDQHLRRMVREVARRGGKATLSEAVLLTIPQRLADPQAILWDRQKENLVYATALQESGRRTRLIVHVGFARQGQRTNAVISGGVVGAETLQNRGQYDVIVGDP